MAQTAMQTKTHIPPRSMCVYCFALNSDLSVDIWEPNPDPAFARHPTMFGLIALGWVDWIDAGLCRGWHPQCHRRPEVSALDGHAVAQKKHVDDTANQKYFKKGHGAIIAAPM